MEQPDAAVGEETLGEIWVFLETWQERLSAEGAPTQVAAFFRDVRRLEQELAARDATLAGSLSRGVEGDA